MSKNTKEVYNYIIQYTQAHLYPPSYADIIDDTSLKSTVLQHIEILEDLNLVIVD